MNCPHLLDNMIYYLIDGVIYYVARKTEQTVHAGIQEAGSSETKAKIFSQSSALNRSTAPCNILLSFETNAENRQIRVCYGRNHNNFSRKQGQIRLPADYGSAAQQRVPCES